MIDLIGLIEGVMMIIGVEATDRVIWQGGLRGVAVEGVGVVTVGLLVVYGGRFGEVAGGCLIDVHGFVDSGWVDGGVWCVCGGVVGFALID